MKKAIVLSVVGIAASGIAAFAQGTINFGNYTATSYQPVYYNLSPALAPAGLAGQEVNDANVEVQLFYELGDESADTVSAFLATATAGSTTFIVPGENGSDYVGNPAVAGVTGGPGGYFAPVNQIINGWSAGSVTFLAEAWETAGAYGGATYATSLLKGNTGLFLDNGSDIVTVASHASPSFLDNPAIELSTTVPEPTTMALGGLGLAALMLFRRKQA